MKNGAALRKTGARSFAGNHAGRSERQPEGRFLRALPGWVWLGAALLAGWGLLSPNPLLTAYAMLLLPVMASLLWFAGEPPALAFACFMQWAQAAAAVFYSNAYGVPLASQFEYGGAKLVTATWLSLTGVLVLAAGMRSALWGRPPQVVAEAVDESRQLEPARVFAWYLASFVFLSASGWVGGRVSGLAQPLGALGTLKSVLLFLLAHAVLTQQRGYFLLGIATFFEFALGVLGFFSSFKNIFFLLLVVVAAVPFVSRGRRLASLAVLATAMLVLSVVWTAVKQDYRDFLNQGTGQQVALVPVSQRATKLLELVGNLNGQKIHDGLEQLVLRVSYVSFFATTLETVPDVIPFERGKLWWESIRHVLMPRLFFPDKPPINDSDRVNRYSGTQVATAEQGTSISLGYMTESYIDFGPVGMFAPIFLLGVFYGLIYRFFAWKYRPRLPGLAMATAILIFGAYLIESSNIKLVGGNLMCVVVIGAFAKTVGRWLWPQLRRPQPGHRALAGVAREGLKPGEAPGAR